MGENSYKVESSCHRAVRTTRNNRYQSRMRTFRLVAFGCIPGISDSIETRTLIRNNAKAGIIVMTRISVVGPYYRISDSQNDNLFVSTTVPTRGSGGESTTWTFA